MRIYRCPITRRPPRPRRLPSDLGDTEKTLVTSVAHFDVHSGHRFVGEKLLKTNADFVRVAAQLSAALLLATLLGCKSQVSGDVMATVDGRKIFRSDVDKYYENQVASAQQSPTGEQATILRLNILRQLIDDEMVMRRAEKLGLLATEEEVDRK